MKIDKKLMNEVEALWDDHAEALVHFGEACVAASKAGRRYGIRKCLRRGMIMATAATIIITSFLDLIDEVY